MMMFIIPMAEPLPDAPLWICGNGLEILLLLLGAILLTRFATWLRAMITDRIDANDRESDATCVQKPPSIERPWPRCSHLPTHRTLIGYV